MTKVGMSYMVKYKEAGDYSFTCRVVDNHGLRGKGNTVVTVKSGKNNFWIVQNTFINNIIWGNSTGATSTLPYQALNNTNMAEIAAHVFPPGGEQ